MFIQLRPVCRTKDSTISTMWIDGKYLCFIVEDGIREKKIPGHTCIPAGIYKLVRDTSSKFVYEFGYCWWIQDVTGFSEIKIHKGNTIQDTRGCLLPNLSLKFDGLNYFGAQSAPAYEMMMRRLEGFQEHKIEIIRSI